MLKKIKNSIGKNSRFLFDYLQFKKFLENQQIEKQVKKTDDKEICIAVLPWMGTAVPWYAITIALILGKKNKNIFILFDDMPFGDDELFHKIQSKLILKTLKRLEVKWVKLSDYNSIVTDNEEIKYLSRLNSLHYTRGETNYELRQSYERKIQKQLTQIYSKVNNFYNLETPSQIISPGGIWGSSGVFSLLAKKNNSQISTYDSGESILLLSIFGVAAQLKDIPFAFNAIVENSEQKQLAIVKGQEQLQKRREGDDTHSHFTDATNTSEFGDDYYLMLLNSVWDSAALGLHTVYDSMIEWIIDSIDWVLNNTEKTIIIRQHPAERVDVINNTDSYGKQIESRFGKNKRVIFIEAKRDINTYDLIENASCVLGFSSTSIVESVALGKPAIIVSSTYYAKFGIVFNANNKEEYYEYLQKATKNDLTVTQEMKDRACISNYITQTCNWYKTEFTPNRNDFLKWSKQSLEELEKDYLPLHAIIENKPVSLLQHEEIKNAN